MAFICKRTEKCDGCRFYRADEDGQPACWAAYDGRKITKIILDTWNANREDYIKYGDTLNGLCIWVSFIMCYGYTPAAIIDYAKVRGFKYDPHDCDPDDPDDHYGAIQLTKINIAELEEEMKNGRYEL